MDDGAVDISMDVRLPDSGNGSEAGRSAIADCIKKWCGSTNAEAIAVQAQWFGQFMAGKHYREGRIHTDAANTLQV